MLNTINLSLKVYVQEAKEKEVYEEERAQAWNEVSFYFLLLKSVNIFNFN